MGFVDALEQACSFKHMHVLVPHKAHRWASAINTLSRTALSGWAYLTMKSSLGELTKCVCRSSPTARRAGAHLSPDKLLRMVVKRQRWSNVYALGTMPNRPSQANSCS